MALLGSHEETPSAAKDLSLTSRETISGIAVLTDESVCPTFFVGQALFACQPFSQLLPVAALSGAADVIGNLCQITPA
jgi:hypothetical protein